MNKIHSMRETFVLTLCGLLVGVGASLPNRPKNTRGSLRDSFLK